MTARGRSPTLPAAFSFGKTRAPGASAYRYIAEENKTGKDPEVRPTWRKSRAPILPHSSRCRKGFDHAVHCADRANLATSGTRVSSFPWSGNRGHRTLAGPGTNCIRDAYNRQRWLHRALLLQASTQATRAGPKQHPNTAISSDINRQEL